MSWCWLALVEERPPDCFAAADLREGGAPAGVLAAWPRGRKPVRHALRADARIADSRAGPAWASLVLAPAGVRLRFDDLAVQQARRELLARWWPDAASALLRDASHYEGSILAVRRPELMEEDPFARIFPARVLEVGPGLLARVPPPTGPAIERYGSANPWPATDYDGRSPARVNNAEKSLHQITTVE